MLKTVSGWMSAVVICAAMFLGGGDSHAEEPSEAFGFYLNYLKTASSADAISDISPFMPSWWRGRYESADESTQSGALERQRKLARDLKDILLEKEEILDEAVRLHMTATEQNDLPMRGEVLLVREGDGFVLEETKWATSQ